MSTRLTRRLGALILPALLATSGFVAPAPVAAVSPDVVISQVYGGGGNSGATYTHDFIELFNRGTSTVSLSGWSVQYASATGTGNFGSTATQITPLPPVSLAPGQYLLIQEAQGSGGTTSLPTPDLDDATPIAMGATAGKVIVASTASGIACNGGSTPCSPTQLAQIVDLIGFGTANFFETAPAPAPSNFTAAIRASGGCTDTDDNSGDFAVAAPFPRNMASPLNECGQPNPTGIGAATPPTVAPGATSLLTVGVTPASGPTSTGLAVTADLFTIGGSAVQSFYDDGTHGDATSGDLTFSYLATVGAATSVGAKTLPVSITDAQARTGSASISLTVASACGSAFTPVFAIQGSGASAAITGVVTTQGVVVGDFEGSASQSGFYLQDATGDGDPATSDGIFVYTGSSDLVTAGEVVRVTGYARERFNQTTLNGSNSNSSPVMAANILDCGSGTITPADVTLPFASASDPERFEGMSVRLPQSLVISEYFNYDRFGEIVLALPLDGESRPFTGTAIDEPGAAANARTLANSLSRITLDDAVSAQNPPVLRHPDGAPFSLTNRFRGGDTVANTIGVLGFDFSLYRIFPTGPADYTATNPHPSAPEPVGGSLRVAAMNTLNFFLTLDYPTGNPLDNTCGPLQGVECRGADADQPLEFSRQRDKLIAALAGLDADVIGLMELENTTGVDPLGDPTKGIVAGLNALLGPDTYAFIDTGVIGTDAIRAGIIYRPAAVAPVGAYKLLDSSVDPRFLDTKNRPALAQTFLDPDTGGRFTMVVNHLKSKGSSCDDVGDPDLGDGQGNCAGTRELAAEALVDWLATDPTGSGDPDFVIMGDLNSYAMEDSIDAVKAGPDDIAGTGDDYTNLIAHFQGTYAYSYLFDGQFGYLDHALASSTLFPQVTGAADWHINADEPDVLDYDTSFKPDAQDALYEANASRASDHDPVVIGLNLVNDPPELGAISVSAATVPVGTLVTATVPFTDPDALDTHTATWDWGDGTTSAGAVSESLGAGTISGSHAYAAAGFYTIEVTVADDFGNTDHATFDLVVYDPLAGFVTGGGWIASPAGAYVADPTVTGKATIGFVAMYPKDAGVPVGSTTFRFPAAGFKFDSTSLDWLVVVGSTATYKGTGTVNDAGSYSFMLTASDGSPDTLRLRIWSSDAGGDHTVYDNGSSQAIDSGSIVVHKGK